MLTCMSHRNHWLRIFAMAVANSHLSGGTYENRLTAVLLHPVGEKSLWCKIFDLPNHGWRKLKWISKSRVTTYTRHMSGMMPQITSDFTSTWWKEHHSSASLVFCKGNETSNQWIPLTAGQKCRICFYITASSWFLIVMWCKSMKVILMDLHHITIRNHAISNLQFKAAYINVVSVSSLYTMQERQWYMPLTIQTTDCHL